MWPSIGRSPAGHPLPNLLRQEPSSDGRRCRRRQRVLGLGVGEGKALLTCKRERALHSSELRKSTARLGLLDCKQYGPLSGIKFQWAYMDRHFYSIHTMVGWRAHTRLILTDHEVCRKEKKTLAGPRLMGVHGLVRNTNVQNTENIFVFFLLVIRNWKLLENTSRSS